MKATPFQRMLRLALVAVFPREEWRGGMQARADDDGNVDGNWRHHQDGRELFVGVYTTHSGEVWLNMGIRGAIEMHRIYLLPEVSTTRNFKQTRLSQGSEVETVIAGILEGLGTLKGVVERWSLW